MPRSICLAGLCQSVSTVGTHTGQSGSRDDTPALEHRHPAEGRCGDAVVGELGAVRRGPGTGDEIGYLVAGIPVTGCWSCVSHCGCGSGSDSRYTSRPAPAIVTPS